MPCSESHDHCRHSCLSVGKADMPLKQAAPTRCSMSEAEKRGLSEKCLSDDDPAVFVESTRTLKTFGRSCRESAKSDRGCNFVASNFGQFSNKKAPNRNLGFKKIRPLNLIPQLKWNVDPKSALFGELLRDLTRACESLPEQFEGREKLVSLVEKYRIRGTTGLVKS